MSRFTIFKSSSSVFFLLRLVYHRLNGPMNWFVSYRVETKQILRAARYTRRRALMLVSPYPEKFFDTFRECAANRYNFARFVSYHISLIKAIEFQKLFSCKEIFSCKLFGMKERIRPRGAALFFPSLLGGCYRLLQFIGCVGNKRPRDFGVLFQSGFFLFRFLQFGIEPVLVFNAVLQFFFKPRVLRKERGDLPFVGLFSARLFERFGCGRERCNFI